MGTNLLMLSHGFYNWLDICLRFSEGVDLNSIPLVKLVIWLSNGVELIK